MRRRRGGPAASISARPHERGHVPEAHRPDPAVLDGRPRLEAPRRDVDDDAVDALASRDHPVVERPGDERDRPVPAGRRVALVVEEDDPEVGAVVVRRDDVAAVHVRMPARLEDEQPPHVVGLLEREAPALQDRRTLEGRRPARDDAEGLAARVVVDDLDPHAAHGSGPGELGRALLEEGVDALPEVGGADGLLLESRLERELLVERRRVGVLEELLRPADRERRPGRPLAPRSPRRAPRTRPRRPPPRRAPSRAPRPPRAAGSWTSTRTRGRSRAAGG